MPRVLKLLVEHLEKATDIPLPQFETVLRAHFPEPLPFYHPKEVRPCIWLAQVKRQFVLRAERKIEQGRTAESKKGNVSSKDAWPLDCGAKVSGPKEDKVGGDEG